VFGLSLLLSVVLLLEFLVPELVIIGSVTSGCKGRVPTAGVGGAGLVIGGLTGVGVTSAGVGGAGLGAGWVTASGGVF
jgi:hypothetical protein